MTRVMVKPNFTTAFLCASLRLCGKTKTHFSTNPRSLPYVSGIMAAASKAGIQTMKPTATSEVVMFVPNDSCISMRKGISKVTAPRMKFVTVAVTVTRKLVPKCSEVAVTKTDR